VPLKTIPAPTLSTTGNIIGSTAAPVGCSGYESVNWYQNNAGPFQYTIYPHEVHMSCNPSAGQYGSLVAYIEMYCKSTMFFLGQQVPDGAGDNNSGWQQNYCDDTGYWSPGQYNTVDAPLVHNVVVTLTIVSSTNQQVVWDTSNNGAIGAFCGQGGGTPTLTCTDNPAVLAGNGSYKSY